MAHPFAASSHQVQPTTELDGSSELSTIIVSWNTRELLKKCLRSIFTHTSGVNFEVIVVDNDSADGSPALVAEEFPRVRLIQSGGNLGFARACNMGMWASHGRYIMLLNSDTEIQGNVFPGFVEVLAQCPQVGALGPRLESPDGSVQPFCARRQKTVMGAIFSQSFPRLNPLSLFLKGELWSSPLCYETDSLSGAAMVFRRETLDRIGYLDEGLFMYNEDDDFCDRLREAGYKIGFLPQLRIIHHQGASSKQDITTRTIVALTSNIYYIRKRFGWGSAFLFRLVMTANLFLRLLTVDPLNFLTKVLQDLPGERLRADLLGLLYLLNIWGHAPPSSWRGTSLGPVEEGISRASPCVSTGDPPYET